METINIDDFDSPSELFLAAGKLVETQRDVLRMIQEVNSESDLLVFLPVTEALLHSFAVLAMMAEQTLELAKKGAIDFSKAEEYFVKVTMPAAHIITEHNARHQRLTRSSDS